MGDIPVYSVRPENADGPVRMLHRDHLLPCGFLPEMRETEESIIPAKKPRTRQNDAQYEDEPVESNGEDYWQPSPAVLEPTEGRIVEVYEVSKTCLAPLLLDTGNLPWCTQGELSQDPSTGEQSAPDETLAEISSDDTVANNPLGNEIEFQNPDGSLEARGEEYNLPEISMEGTVETVPRESPEQSLLVPDSSNGQGVDLKNSEKQHLCWFLCTNLGREIWLSICWHTEWQSEHDSKEHYIFRVSYHLNYMRDWY